MPAPPPRPPTDDGTHIPLCDIPLRDVDGTDIPLQCRVEQVAVDQARGALPSRLHQQGEVIGRSAHWVYVRFECEHSVIALRPHLIRVLEAPSGY
ncbi:MAG: hypothetical protein JO100_16085 [Pseudonocardia sp.]|nr:hypothetical protein [Pseudonocardiales bacterium]MBV9315207.1 hypothetical protein [Pseudonocardia sp.]